MVFIYVHLRNNKECNNKEKEVINFWDWVDMGMVGEKGKRKW